VQNLGNIVLMGIWSVQKVCKIAENAKRRSLKWGFYCICMTLAFWASHSVLWVWCLVWKG